MDVRGVRKVIGMLRRGGICLWILEKREVPWGDLRGKRKARYVTVRYVNRRG